MRRRVCTHTHTHQCIPHTHIQCAPPPTHTYTYTRLADGILVDGDVEEGARDLLELNNSDANGVPATVTAATAAGGNAGGGAVGGAGGHSRKRPPSGNQQYLYLKCHHNTLG